MAGLVVVALFLAMAGHSSATWCICKDGVSDTALQKTLDYACGAGADCNPIHQTGPCYNPNTVKAHCNYAVNSYFQRKGQAAGSCDFAGTASPSPSDPSTAGCNYPSSASAAGTVTTPVTTMPNTPTTALPNTGTPTTNTGNNSPYVTSPNNGVLGGVGTSLGPSGTGINDESDAGFTIERDCLYFFLIAFVSLGLMFLWG